jgi:hypothetical protein
MSRFVGAGKKLMSFLVPKANVPKTEIQKKIRDLKISTQKSKASKAKLDQTIFELKNNKPFTFKSNKGKSESNTESYKRITKENNKVIKNMLDKAVENKKDGGRMGLKGGSDDGSSLNKSINSLKRIMENKKKSKITTSRRDRSPMERQRVLDKMKSEAQAMGGNVRTAGEMSPLKGESTKSFKERTDAKVGGRMGRKFGSPNPRKSNVQKIKETFGSKKNVPSKLKGFSKLPEKVQQQMNKKLARKV